MTDTVSPKRRRAIMSKIRHKGMKPEMTVRRLTHAMGYRYRLHRSDLPGKPDLAFPGRRKVIFVHGCFWHQHNDPACKIARVPQSNTEYWLPKLARNAERDIEHCRELAEMGWAVLVLWECQVKQDPDIANRIREFLEQEQRDDTSTTVAHSSVHAYSISVPAPPGVKRGRPERERRRLSGGANHRLHDAKPG